MGEYVDHIVNILEDGFQPRDIMPLMAIAGAVIWKLWGRNGALFRRGKEP